jgi:hypothetical protein
VDKWIGSVAINRSLLLGVKEGIGGGMNDSFEHEMEEILGEAKALPVKLASAPVMVREGEIVFGKGLPNKEGDGSKPLRNYRHEQWCHLVCEGKSDVAAYKMVNLCSQATAEDRAWDIRARSEVARRLVYLQECVSSKKILTLRERREFLASVVRTPVGAIDEHSPLAQEVVYEESDRGSRTKVKMPGKLEALKLDAEMAGELTPAGSASPHMRLRLIASTSGDAASVAAEIDGI